MYTNLLFLVKGKTKGEMIDFAKAVLEVLTGHKLQGRFDFVQTDSAVTVEIDWDGRDSFRPDSMPAMWVVGTRSLEMTNDQEVEFRQDLITACKMDVILII